MNLTSLTQRFVRAAALIAGLLFVGSPVSAHELGNSATSALASTEQIWNQPSSYRQESLYHARRCAEAVCAELKLQASLLEGITDPSANHVVTYLHRLQSVLPNDTEVGRFTALANTGDSSALAEALSSLHLGLIGARSSYMDSIVDFQEWLGAARLLTPGGGLEIPSRFVESGPVPEPIEHDSADLELTLWISEGFVNPLAE